MGYLLLATLWLTGHRAIVHLQAYRQSAAAISAALPLRQPFRTLGVAKDRLSCVDPAGTLHPAASEIGPTVTCRNATPPIPPSHRPPQAARHRSQPYPPLSPPRRWLHQRPLHYPQRALLRRQFALPRLRPAPRRSRPQRPVGRRLPQRQARRRPPLGRPAAHQRKQPDRAVFRPGTSYRATIESSHRTRFRSAYVSPRCGPPC